MSSACAADGPGRAPRAYGPEYYYGETLPAIWTGYYLGAYGGYSGGRDAVRDNSAVPYDAPSANSFNLHDGGYTVGGVLGYNYQIDSLVLGVEGDVGVASFSKSGIAGNAVAGDVRAGVHADFIATLRPRIGVAFDQALIYGTAGFAIANLSTSINDSCTVGRCNPNTISAGNDTIKLGYAVGAGLEYMFSRHWTTKVEFIHTVFDGIKTSGVGANGNSYAWNHDVREEAVRAGVNYKF